MTISLWVPQFLFPFEVYLRFRRRGEPPPSRGTVDIFVTGFDEPEELFERSIKAAVAISYPHETYLLDDSADGCYEALARRAGARYLTREGKRDHKAGNINAALARTQGKFIAVFDADHVPVAGFLDRTIGYFNDERIGFVQCMLTFSNHRESVIARGAAETALEYYNVSAVGTDCLGAASMMGSNVVIRREALDSIGGYQSGLAEDLETSVDLHAAGWRSAYVAEELAPGLAPASLGAFFKQQFKWSRGVFEAAIRSAKGSFWRLTPRQKRCYLTRFTYYLAGATTLLGILALSGVLLMRPSGAERLTLRALPVVAGADAATLGGPLVLGRAT